MSTDEMAAIPAADEEDAAWISMDLPLPLEELFASLQNTERLFRLNPYLEIVSWRDEFPGRIAPGKRFRVETANELNGLHQTRTLTVDELVPGKGYTLRYDSGLKQSTVISAQALTPSSSRLVVKDCYPTHLSPAQREARLSEVDKSLAPWGDAIRRYYVSRKSWGWLPFHSGFQDGFWLKIPPRQRRTARLIVWVSLLEFVVFLFVFFIYWLELGRT